MFERYSFSTMAPLLLVLVIDVMGFGLVLPVLGPLFVDAKTGILPTTASLSERDLLYGITVAVFPLLSFFGNPFLGDLSDRLGRKNALIISLLGSSFGFILSAVGIFSKSVILLIVGRAVGGFAAGSQAIAQAAIVDISSEQNKAFNLSLMSIATCLGFMMGPLLGGYFSSPTFFKHFTYDTPFEVAAALALINAITLYFTFEETFIVSKITKLSITKGLFIFIAAFKKPTLRNLVMIAVLIELSWGLYFQYISLFLSEAYHYTSVEIGHFMVFMGLIFSISMLLVIRIALNHFSVNVLALWSLMLLVIGTLLVSVFNNEWAQWLCIIPIAMGAAINWSCMLTLFSNAVDKASQGWAMGMFAAISSISFLISGLAMGLISYVNVAFPFVLASFFGAWAFFSLCIFINKGVFHD